LSAHAIGSGGGTNECSASFVIALNDRPTPAPRSCPAPVNRARTRIARASGVRPRGSPRPRPWASRPFHEPPSRRSAGCA